MQDQWLRGRLKRPLVIAIVLLPAMLACGLLARALPGTVVPQLMLAALLAAAAAGLAEMLLRRLAPAAQESEKALAEGKELFDLFMRHSPIYTFIKEVTAT